MRCAIYARVSTGLDSQKDSLESQVSYFENYIKEKKWSLVNSYIDEGITGTSTARRDSLKRLLHDAEKNLFDIVLIKSLSRLSRDTSDTIHIFRTLESNSIKLYASREGEIKDEMMLSFVSAVNQRQSEDTAYNVSWGIREKSKTGIFHGTPPYGYDKIKPGKLILNPVTAPIVRMIFDMYLHQGRGVQAIANYLNEHCIKPSRKGSKQWYDSAIRLILTNPHYTGNLFQGRTVVDSKDKLHLQKKGYKRRKPIDSEDWIIVNDTHEAIVSKEEFDAVQIKLKERGSRVFRGKGDKALFARIAFCADCGAGMNFKKDRGMYVCSTYHKTGVSHCTSHAIKDDVLTNTVLSNLRTLINDSLNMSSLVDIAIKEANVRKNKLNKQIDTTRTKLNQLEREIVQLTRKWSSGDLELSLFQSCCDAINNEKLILTQQLSKIESELTSTRDTEQQISSFKVELSKAAQLQTDNKEVLRDILQRLISRIEVHKDKSIEITYNFQNPLKKGA